MIKAIKFVSIPVKNQDKALEFYTKSLGFGIATDQPMGPGMADDVAKTHAELVKRGVEFAQPPTTQPWGTFAIFKDVDGNQFVLSSK